MQYKYKRRQYQIKKKRSIFKKRLFWWPILLFLLIIGVLYFITFSPTIQIQTIRFHGAYELHLSLQKIAEQVLPRKIITAPLYTKSIFLANISEFKKQAAKIDNVKKVNIIRDFPNELIVYIEKRTSIGFWCENQSCYYIDNQGIIFGKGAQSTTSSDLVISQESALNAAAGEQIMEPANINAISLIHKTITYDLGLNIDKFIIQQDRLTVKLSTNEKIFFNELGDIKKQLFNLEALLEENNFFENRPIQYIDLRFGNKVFYK